MACVNRWSCKDGRAGGHGFGRMAHQKAAGSSPPASGWGRLEARPAGRRSHRAPASIQATCHCTCQMNQGQVAKAQQSFTEVSQAQAHQGQSYLYCLAGGKAHGTSTARLGMGHPDPDMRTIPSLCDVFLSCKYKDRCSSFDGMQPCRPPPPPPPPPPAGALPKQVLDKSASELPGACVGCRGHGMFRCLVSS